MDSADKNSSEFVPFLNIVNEWYLRDCSRKIGAAYQVKGKSGRPTTNHPPYGYKKDPNDKDHWLVDEEAAAVVRRIFRLSIEGCGPYRIARILQEDHVECPSFHLGTHGLVLTFGNGYNFQPTKLIFIFGISIKYFKNPPFF